MRSWAISRPRDAPIAAHRDLALAGPRPGEEQVGEVEAGDQQNQAGDRQQQPERAVVGRAQLAEAGRRRHRLELEVAWYCWCVNSAIARDLCRRLDVRAEAAQMPGRAAAVQPSRSRPITVRSNRSRRSSAGRHKGVAMSKRLPTTRPRKPGAATPMTSCGVPSTSSDAFAPNSRPPISRLPEVVADDDARRRAWAACRRPETPAPPLDASVESVARHQTRGHAYDGPARRGERHRPGEQVEARCWRCISARLRPRQLPERRGDAHAAVAAGDPHFDDLVRAMTRQAAQPDRVQELEDRGVGADAQRQ